MASSRGNAEGQVITHYIVTDGIKMWSACLLGNGIISVNHWGRLSLFPLPFLSIHFPLLPFPPLPAPPLPHFPFPSPPFLFLSGACQVDVAVSTSSCHADLSNARRLAVARPKLRGRRSSCTVLSQDCLGLPTLRRQSLGGPRMHD